MKTCAALSWTAIVLMQRVAAFSSLHNALPSTPKARTVADIISLQQSYRGDQGDNYNGVESMGEPLFGRGEYFGGRQGSNSENFRQASRGERYRRRENLRSGPDYGQNEIAFGGRRQYNGDDRQYGSIRNDEQYGSVRRGGRMQGQRQDGNQGGGWQDRQYDQGNVRSGTGNGFKRGGSANTGNSRVQNFFTPKQREVRQQQDNQGARYGWQQQYNTDRGNVRAGSSNDFRRGSSNDRMQDYYTPKQREIWQRQDNQGARYGWQQQYNTDRGNVRGGSTSNFVRGSAMDRYQDFSTPREREMRQMKDNRALSRGGQDYGGRGGGGGGGYYEQGGRDMYNGIGGDYEQDGYDGYDRGYERDQYYVPGRSKREDARRVWQDVRRIFR